MEKVQGTLLSVNVNKIATLRNARGGQLPNVLQVSHDLLKYGAHGITVHPRPDGRHILEQDVINLGELLVDWNSENQSFVELNVEGYPSKEFLSLVKKVIPHQVTLVPDPPEVLTSNAGWKIQENQKLLSAVTKELRAEGVRTSFFVDVFTWSPEEFAVLEKIGPDRVELYTEAYARHFGSPEQNKVLDQYHKVAESLHLAGFGVNAGHDLNLDNLASFSERLPFLSEVSIGHAFICDALYFGFKETTKKYLEALGHDPHSD